MFYRSSGSVQAGAASHPMLGWVRRLERYSYELYLFHVVLLALLKLAIPKGEMGHGAVKIGAFALFFAVSAATAACSRATFPSP